MVTAAIAILLSIEIETNRVCAGAEVGVGDLAQ